MRMYEKYYKKNKYSRARTGQSSVTVTEFFFWKLTDDSVNERQKSSILYLWLTEIVVLLRCIFKETGVLKKLSFFFLFKLAWNLQKMKSNYFLYFDVFNCFPPLICWIIEFYAFWCFIRFFVFFNVLSNLPGYF